MQAVSAQLTNVDSLYDFMTRQDFMLPARNRSVITAEFLNKAFAGEVYIPKQADCSPVVRMATHQKQTLKAILVGVIEGHIADGHPLSSKLKLLLPHVRDKDADK